MAQEVFISYSVNDKETADAICSTLEAQGVQCWIAPRDILPGMDWGGAIIDAIASSRVMVLLLSSNSNTSTQVRREVERAIDKDVIVIPFRIENVSLSKSLEYHLSSTHWMDATTPPIERHIQTLAGKIRQILTGEKVIIPPVPPVPPTPRNWLPVYIGAGAGLILLTGLIWMYLSFSPSSDPKTTVQSLDTSNLAAVNTNPAPVNSVENKQAPVNQNKTPAVKTVPDASSQPPIPQIYEKSYDEARKLLIKEGWQPNKKHWSYEKSAEVQSGNGPVFWKRGYWEIVSCSGSSLAECLFEFVDASGRKLHVVTHGEEDENGKYHARVSRANLKAKGSKGEK